MTDHMQSALDDYAEGVWLGDIIDPLGDAVSRLRADGIDTGSVSWTAGRAVKVLGGLRV